MIPARASAEPEPLPGGDFRLFVQRLGYQALISLGILENPVTGSKSVHQAHAEALLADLRMLRAKTSGNLEPDEQAHLDKVISDLGRAFGRLRV